MSTAQDTATRTEIPVVDHAFGATPPPASSREGLDVAAYRARIGYDGPITTDPATVAAVVEHHSRAIPFENLNAFLGLPVALDMASLQAKLIEGGRGGWCFEQNSLLSEVLRAHGVPVTWHAARVIMGRDPSLPLPSRGHMLLQVELDDGAYLIDVGFGGLTPTVPLRLVTDQVQTTPHEPYRVRKIDGDFQVEAEIRGAWQPLYRFGSERVTLSDYELANWYLVNHPASPFVDAPMLARPFDGGRYALQGAKLTIHSGGDSESRSLSSIQELRAVFADGFGLDLTGIDPDLLDRRLARLLP
jgi:N-hydroxyarylamine O-acetyltransferase